MKKPFSRRTFLKSSAIGTGLMIMPSGLLHAAAKEAPFKTRLFKAVISGMPTEEGLAELKKAGFDGIECKDAKADPKQAETARKLAEKHGLRIHSVLRGWVNFDQPQKAPAQIEDVSKCLETAAAYGADAVLLVPCRIRGAMPQPWEFDITLDDKTGHITKVVKGDNTPYQAYIETHNKAADACRDALRKLIPAAEKAKVVVAVENVWNNMWVKPECFAQFIRSCDSEWIQAYYDIGNHVKYAPSEAWIRALGKTIVKCHVKDFKLNANGQGGSWADFRDGSVNWPLVRKELDKLGKDMWMTIEGSGKLSLEEKSKRLDLIAAGK